MAATKLPATYKQTMVKELSTDYRKATEIVENPLPKPGPNEVLVKNRFVGINASDINFSAGRYFPGKSPPFGCGFEALGEVVQAGAESPIKEGQMVVCLKTGAFTEYMILQATEAIPVPSADPGLLTIPLSGLTASISLEKEADLKPGKTVLVTAAAGGTGQFAVQLAKAAGCHVIGTCSNDAKVEFLKGIGCDRPINYKVENLDDVLSKEYPKGLDVVYECIGREVFDTALKHIATQGRMIIIGMISGYQATGDTRYESSANIQYTVLTRSASVRGFFLPHYAEDHARHVGMLSQMHAQGKLKLTVDRGSNKPFTGLESIPDAIDYMYSGKNVGKIVVTLS